VWGDRVKHRGGMKMKNILKKIGGFVVGLMLLAGALSAPAGAVKRHYHHRNARSVPLHRRHRFYHNPARYKYRWSHRHGRHVRVRA
jgi:hypothetical protein